MPNRQVFSLRRAAPSRSSLAALLIVFSALMGCSGEGIDTAPAGPAGQAESAGVLRQASEVPELVDVSSVSSAQREPTMGDSLGEDLPAESELDPNGAKLTITVGASASETVSLYLIDRKGRHYRAFKAAKSKAPKNAWHPVERYGKRLDVPTPVNQGTLTLEIPEPSHLSYVYARAGKRIGKETFWLTKEGPLAIELDMQAVDAEPVKVLRHSGKPAAGIRVRGAVFAEGEDSEDPDFDQSQVTGPTGVAMTYRLPGEDGFVAQIRGLDPVRAEESGEGWRIHLPPMGSVRFSFPSDSRDAIVHLFGERKWRPLLKAEDGGAGPIVFHGIPAGLALTYKGWAKDANAGDEVPPITREGETVNVTLELNVLRRVTMQLMRGEEPVAEGTEVMMILSIPSAEPGGSTSSRELTAASVDAEGRTSALVDEAALALSNVEGVEILTLPKTSIQGQPARAFPAFPKSAAAVIDLGIVEMEPLPLIAAGVVLDPDGRPVQGASVSIRQGVADEDPVELLGIGGGAGRLGGDPKGAVSAENATARTNASGRFELRGLGDPTDRGFYDIYIRVRSREYPTSESVSFVAGETDIKVQLSGRGRMTIDPGGLDKVIGRLLSVRLTHDLTGETRSFRLPRARPVKRLTPGSYTLDLLLAGATVLSIEELIVKEGQECRDPRLRLDIGQRLERRRLRVMGIAPSARVTVFLQGEDEQGWRRMALRNSDGWIDFAYPRALAPRQFVGLVGHVSSDVTGLANGSQVRPEPLQKVLIRFEGARAPSPGTHVMLTPPEPYRSHPQLQSYSAEVDPDGNAAAWVPGPGEYGLRLWITPADPPPTSTQTLTVEGPVAVVEMDTQ